MKAAVAGSFAGGANEGLVALLQGFKQLPRQSCRALSCCAAVRGIVLVSLLVHVDAVAAVPGVANRQQQADTKLYCSCEGTRITNKVCSWCLDSCAFRPQHGTVAALADKVD